MPRKRTLLIVGDSNILMFVEKLIFWSVDQKMLEYTPVALESRQSEDTLPQQQPTHFFHDLTAMCV